MAKKRLVLIDGNAILHRAYFALPPLTTRGGQPVNAVYGFTTMLLKVIADLKPTHLAVAFDTEKPTFRHAEYVGYQAQRPRMEADLSSQIEIVQDLIRTFGIPIYVLEGYEADDVIGTLAKQTTEKLKNKKTKKQQVDEVIIVSGDRDLLQLVGKKIKVYAPIKGLSEARLFDEKGVKEYMGVKPSQIVDYKGLVGDASDNYPGVPGVGPKTATALLEEFGTITGIYEALKVKSKKQKAKILSEQLVQKLIQGQESAMLSQKLARIVTDAPVEFDLKEMRFRGVEGRKEAIERLGELGFKSLVARLDSARQARLTGKKKDETKEKKKGNGQLELL